VLGMLLAVLRLSPVRAVAMAAAAYVNLIRALPLATEAFFDRPASERARQFLSKILRHCCRRLGWCCGSPQGRASDHKFVSKENIHWLCVSYILSVTSQ
jgi:ABC-type amino acid transport system permease subunit